MPLFRRPLALNSKPKVWNVLFASAMDRIVASAILVRGSPKPIDGPFAMNAEKSIIIKFISPQRSTLVAWGISGKVSNAVSAGAGGQNLQRGINAQKEQEQAS